MAVTVATNKIECVVRAADQLGETPIWSDVDHKLWWVDIERPRLQSFDPTTGRHEVHCFDATFLGSQALTVSGTHLLARDLELCHRNRDSGALEHFATVERDIDNRLNDGRVDARGRLWIGTMDNQLHRPNGSLYRVDSDGSVKRILDGVIVSNGVTFSPDGSTLYFTDTRRYCTWRFDLDLDDGSIANRQVFADYSSSGERPDGACVDVDGAVWTAFFAGSRVVRYRPDGTIDLIVPLPITNPTCVCFGGADFRTLYVTSATKFLTPEQRSVELLAGGLFAIHGIGQGMPEHRFGS